MEFRDLKRQYQALRTEIDNALVSTAASGSFIGGDAVSTLEHELSEYVGVSHCISCANGTDALTLALKVWGIGPGDAVFVPDFTFFSTAEVVAAEGATPVFVDVCADTFNISASDLERKISSVLAEGDLRPAAVIPVDLFGLPFDFSSVRSVADNYGLKVLEDGAQGFGGSAFSRRACSLGDIATTSFFPAKPLGCYGDGGAIFTDNDDWAALIGSLKVHGKGKFKYDNVRVGMNSRLDSIQAAVLSVKLRAFVSGELDAVNRVAARYSELLGGIVATPSAPNGYVSSWAQYTITLESSFQRDSLLCALKADGIPSMVYYPKPMHAQTAFSGKQSYGPCPEADRLCATVLSLPMHPYMTDAEIEEVTLSVKRFFKK